MKLICLIVARISIIGLVFALPLVFADSVSAQSQNMTPNMVINMSDLSIKVGNTTSNETITFSNNTSNNSADSGNTTP